MSDIFSKEKRSEIMSKVSSKETKLEKAVRSFLFKNGLRFRKNVKKLPGTPDIVLSKYKTVIFINGCFWHGHSCKKGQTPSSNIDFWINKLKANKMRDVAVMKQLKELGWDVITLWECELTNKKKFDETVNNLVSLLRNNKA